MANAAIDLLQPVYASAQLPLIADATGINLQRLDTLFMTKNPDPLSLTASEWEMLINGCKISVDAWVAEARCKNAAAVENAKKSDITIPIIYASGSVAAPSFTQQSEMQDVLAVISKFFTEVARQDLKR